MSYFDIILSVVVALMAVGLLLQLRINQHRQDTIDAIIRFMDATNRNQDMQRKFNNNVTESLKLHDASITMFLDLIQKGIATAEKEKKEG